MAFPAKGEEARAGEGPPYRLKAEVAPPTVSKFGTSIDNIYSMFERTVSNYPGNKCFGTRTADGFDWMTYQTVMDQVKACMGGVAAFGLPRNSTFGMYTVNCPAFQIAAIACFGLGLTCVPIYDTLGDNIVQYEVNHAEIALIFVESKKLEGVTNVINDCPTLKHAVVLDSAANGTTLGSSCALTDLATLMAKGKGSPVEAKPAGGDDLAFIMYTSGTTGDPKGVCIKQLSITIGASYCAGIELYPSDRYLSFLPLAHIFETMVEHAILATGGSIGFFGGNLKKLNDDVLALKPTIFVGVPRVYQRFYEAAEQKIEALTGIKKCLVPGWLKTETALKAKGKSSFRGKILAKALGKKIHGGCVRLMISGAAPLPVHVQQFLLAAMGCAVVQGYGMTENCANATLADLRDYRAGHVGPPMPTVEVKLVDVPEMEYTTAKNSCGEVCTRGAVNFSGYYKNQEETDKVLDADGWLHTGDIGRWNPDGTLSIIDRKKNIFKLSQGEYVAAEKIEMIVSKSKYVGQPWIYGNSFLPMLVAVVTPDYASLKEAAAEGGWACDSNEELAKKPEAKKFILQKMIEEGKAAKLKTFELPQAVFLEGSINDLNQGFSIDNDCLTPTFKLKRPQLLKRYQAQVDEMYTALGEDPAKAFASLSQK